MKVYEYDRQENGLDTHVCALNVDLHKPVAPCKMSFLVNGQIINP